MRPVRSREVSCGDPFELVVDDGEESVCEVALAAGVR
jgi:hypothetical protein